MEVPKNGQTGQKWLKIRSMGAVECADENFVLLTNGSEIVGVSVGLASSIWRRFVDRNGVDRPRSLSSPYKSIKNDMISKAVTTGTFREREELYQI